MNYVFVAIIILSLEQQESIVICVSPLLSLMMDQKEKFIPLGISTEFVGEDAHTDAINKVLSGTVQLVYISPESLICNPMYRSMLLSNKYKEKLVGLVVDEAHCVKTWLVFHECCYNCMIILHRGDDFRIAYAHLGDLRSLIPSTVNVMCLTATATIDTYQAVCQRLSLINPVLIGCPANRDNIYYEVKSLPDVGEFCATIANDISHQGVEYPKTIIFFRQYTDCALMYHVLQDKLGKHITFPPGYPVLQEFRVIDMYTRASTAQMKEKVLKSFCDTKGKLRIVLATTAFGMGVDCSDVRVIFHWGPPTSLEQYSQESGRAGRDNLPSKAILLFGKPGHYIDKEMKAYAENKTSCRRQMMFKNFLFYEPFSSTQNDHCCDICIGYC